VVNLSVRRFEQVQNRKVVAQYMKQAPRPTLGQLLQSSFDEEYSEETAAEPVVERRAAQQENVSENSAENAAENSDEESLNRKTQVAENN
jgi:hypothetical protein